MACRHVSVLGRPLTNPVVDAAEHQQQKGGNEAGQHEDYQRASGHAARDLQDRTAAECSHAWLARCGLTGIMCRRMLFRLLTWAMHTLEHSSVLLLGASLPDVHPWNLQQEAHCISESLQRGQAQAKNITMAGSWPGWHSRTLLPEFLLHGGTWLLPH